MYYTLKPEYYDKFRCVGSDCKDHCCKDWTITIDENTYNKYMNTSDEEFKQKLIDNIIVEKDKEGKISVIKFKLENGKCKFLTDDNLCEIYKKLGEENMCNTCKIYPRVHNSINGYAEKGLSTSCI